MPTEKSDERTVPPPTPSEPRPSEEVRAEYEAAWQRVKKLAKLEREGEHVTGELLNLRLKSNVPLGR